MASDPQPAAPQRPPSIPARAWRAWRGLVGGQRMTVAAALSLLITMFLPWFSEHGIAGGKTPVGLNLTAWDAFSLVELMVLFVGIGVLALMFVRGEGRGIGIPGGDGTLIFLAGTFVAILLLYRVFDRPGGEGITTGVQWGLFLALAAAVWLAMTGRAMRLQSSDGPAKTAGRLPPKDGAPAEPLTRDGARNVTFDVPQDHYDE